MKHMYSVIRYVPDPIRGEFINVGAIAGSDDSSEWEVRQVDNPARARRLDERGTLTAVWAVIDQLGRLVDAHEEAIERPTLGVEALLSEMWLEEISASYRNIVQLSPPTPISAETAAEALDEVFAQLIVDPEPHRGGENTKHPALAAVRRAYRDAGLEKNQQLHERVVVHAGDHRERLDFAVANGRVVQLAQTWSFRVADQDALAESVRAWGWTIRAVKDQGGTITVNEREIEVPSDVDLEVVLIPPRDGEAAAAIDDARAVFDKLEVRPIDIEHASDVAAVASERLNQATTA
jgi:hypothetical protein